MGQEIVSNKINIIGQYLEKYLDKFITDQPVQFELDPDTGLASLVIQASFSQMAGPANQAGGATIHMPVSVMLTPESAQALLADLPKLEAFLKRASEAPPKPRSVQ